MEKATAEELTKFIQFGCWNNINKNGCLENVMDKLKEYVTDVKPDFIVVTGDNYYPQKEKIKIKIKIKIHLIQNQLSKKKRKKKRKKKKQLMEKKLLKKRK